MTSRRTTGAPAGARSFELYDERMPVRRYKLLLQAFLKRRGAGARQAIAEALGNTRGFVTQITSPAYDLAIPPQHVRTIIRLAGLLPDEERTFLDAYLAAHPERAPDVLGRSPGTGDASGTHTISVTVPALCSPRAQRRLQVLVERFAADTAAAMAELEAELADLPAASAGRHAA